MAESECERLYAAIRSGDLRGVTEILKKVNVTEVESGWPAGDPPLVLASKVGRHVAMLDALLSPALCPVDARTATGETALHCVAEHWEVATLAEALARLLRAGCDPGLTDNLRRQLPLHLLARRMGSHKKAGSPHAVSPPLIASLRLLSERCDVNQQDHKLRTALHVLASAHCTDPEPFLALLRCGADVGLQNDRGETALLEALESNALTAAELLIREASRSPPPKDTPNNTETETEPLKATPENPNAVKIVFCTKKSDVKNPTEQTSPSLNRNVENKVNGNNDDVNNLKNSLRSSRLSDIPETKTLSSKSPEVTLRGSKAPQDSGWLGKSTLYGETALHVAARKDLPGLVSLMLGQRSDLAFVAATDLNGDTALHLAAGRGHVEVVGQLVSCAGIDVNARNRKGLTPLHVAVESGFIHVVKVLLERPQCDVLARTSDERHSSPFDLAQHEYRRRSQPEMSLILVREAERRKLVVR